MDAEDTDRADGTVVCALSGLRHERRAVAVIQELQTDALLDDSRIVRKEALGDRDARIPRPEPDDGRNAQQEHFKVRRAVMGARDGNDERGSRRAHGNGADHGGREFP